METKRDLTIHLFRLQTQRGGELMRDFLEDKGVQYDEMNLPPFLSHEEELEKPYCIFDGIIYFGIMGAKKAVKEYRKNIIKEMRKEKL